MTKAELISAISEKAGLNKNQARDALEALLSSVTDSLKSGNDEIGRASCRERV